MKKLIYVPMIHSSQMMSDAYKALAVRDPSKEDINKLQKSYWDIVEEAVGKLPAQNLKIFFESATTRIANIKEWQEKEPRLGIPEIDVLDRLVRNGATIEPTENKRVCEETSNCWNDFFEINHWFKDELERMSEGSSDFVTEEDEANVTRFIELYAELDELNAKRDVFIAKNIRENLRDGETGILFIGGAHDVIPRLADDIDVELVDERLNDFREFFQEARKEITLEGVTKRLKTTFESKE